MGDGSRTGIESPTPKPRNGMKTRYPGIYTRTLKDGSTTFDVTVTVHGRQKQIRNAGTTLDEAKAAKAQLETEMRAGQIGNAPARLTVADYVEKRWLPAKEPDLGSPESVRSYKYAVARIVEHLGAIRLSQLQGLDVEGFKTSLRRSGLSGTSANLVFAVLKQALRQAVRLRLIAHNPCDEVDAPRKDRYEPPTLDTEAIKRVLEAADATPYGALVYVAAMTGLRWGELAALRWADVDVGAGVLRVPKSKTARGVRAVALGPATVERLHEHRVEQMAFFKEHGAPPPPFVFLTEMGKRLNQGNFNVRFWQKIRTDAKLPTLRFHDLRHVQATLLARAGVHPRVMQERLGHASSRTSLEVYSHVYAGDQVEAAVAVELAFRQEAPR